MKSLATLLKDYESHKDLRLGQYFCNLHMKSSWPELYYCNDKARCIALISEYLVSLNYIDVLPTYEIDNE